MDARIEANTYISKAIMPYKFYYLAKDKDIIICQCLYCFFFKK